MNHIAIDMLKKYIDNKLNEQDQEAVENHIYMCHKCMEAYFSLLETHQITQSTSEDFTDRVVSKMHIYHSQQKNTPRQSTSNKAVTHYFLAAGLTILLTVTGIFQGVLDVANKEQLINRSSITKQIIQEANQFVDQIKEGYNQ